MSEKPSDKINIRRTVEGVVIQYIPKKTTAATPFHDVELYIVESYLYVVNINEKPTNVNHSVCIDFLGGYFSFCC